MLAAVQLDGDSAANAVEIQYVATDGVLPSEFEIRQLAVAEDGPEFFLGFGGIPSHFACVAKESAVAVARDRHSIDVLQKVGRKIKTLTPALSRSTGRGRKGGVPGEGVNAYNASALTGREAYVCSE